MAAPEASWGKKQKVVGHFEPRNFLHVPKKKTGFIPLLFSLPPSLMRGTVIEKRDRNTSVGLMHN